MISWVKSKQSSKIKSNQEKEIKGGFCPSFSMEKVMRFVYLKAVQECLDLIKQGVNFGDVIEAFVVNNEIAEISYDGDFHCNDMPLLMSKHTVNLNRFSLKPTNRLDLFENFIVNTFQGLLEDTPYGLLNTFKAEVRLNNNTSRGILTVNVTFFTVDGDPIISTKNSLLNAK